MRVYSTPNWPSTAARSGELPACCFLFFLFFGCLRALAKGTAWAFFFVLQFAAITIIAIQLQTHRKPGKKRRPVL